MRPVFFFSFFFFTTLAVCAGFLFRLLQPLPGNLSRTFISRNNKRLSVRPQLSWWSFA